MIKLLIGLFVFLVVGSGCTAQKVSTINTISNTQYLNRHMHIVKSGETLSEIAKKYNLSIEDLKLDNNIDNANNLHVGQKLYFYSNKSAKNVYSQHKVTKRVAKVQPKIIRYKGKLKKAIRITATAYTSHKKETDNTPFLAAWNNRIKPGMKIIAVSHDLIEKYGITNGTVVHIKGLKGSYVVRDKMNPRFQNRIDLYMGVNRYRAFRWGKRKVTMLW